jgi:uncharacterized membrane protein YedE/YeeE
MASLRGQDMGVGTSPNLWRAALLGALDGLLVGGCARLALCLLLEHAQREWARQAGPGESINFAEPLPLPFLLVWGALSFAAASTLVHRLLARRNTSALLLWACVGVAGVLCGALGFALLITVEDLMAGRPLNESLSWLSPAVVSGALIPALGMVVPLNVMYGGLIHFVTKRWKKRKALLP